jgi:hypothetical protein
VLNLPLCLHDNDSKMTAQYACCYVATPHANLYVILYCSILLHLCYILFFYLSLSPVISLHSVSLSTVNSLL